MARISPARLLPVAAVLSLVAIGCSSADDATEAEAQFVSAFMQPLDDAGLAYTVEEVCHLARQLPGERWHFQVTLDIEGDPDAIADALADTVDIIDREQDPLLVQQYAGEPRRGWNGVLDEQDDGALLGVTRNNVVADDTGPPLGWRTVCVLAES